jgi:hypothetical protein
MTCKAESLAIVRKKLVFCSATVKIIRREWHASDTLGERGPTLGLSPKGRWQNTTPCLQELG